jgi:ribosomal protein L24E
VAGVIFDNCKPLIYQGQGKNYQIDENSVILFNKKKTRKGSFES